MFSVQEKASHYEDRHDKGSVAAQLITLATLTLRLDVLALQAECCPTERLASLEKELARLAAQFDKAWTEAEAMGVPLNTEIITTDEAGRCYVLALTVDGVVLR